MMTVTSNDMSLLLWKFCVGSWFPSGVVSMTGCHCTRWQCHWKQNSHGLFQYVITIMSVPYIGNIRWPSMKGCVPWIINNYLLLSFTYYIWYLIINNIINYYSKRMSSRCCPNINTSSQRGRHSATCQACFWSIQTSP